MKNKGRAVWLLAVIAIIIPGGWQSRAEGAPTLLRKNRINSRYFEDATGKPVFLTGPHAFLTLQDYSAVSFDYAKYLQAMEDTGTNFLRMWTFDNFYTDLIDLPKGNISPMPFSRTGPGIAADGQLRFNLAVFNQSYFDRLRARVMEAGKHGIYVSIMLFEGIWVNQTSSSDWTYNIHNPANNVNGLSMARADVYTMNNSRWVNLMYAYVDKVVQTVGDLDNVLYEVSNESAKASVSFQDHIIDHIHQYEAGRTKQHMAGMTALDDVGNTDATIKTALLGSHADWISLAKRQNSTEVEDAPATKVSIYDTDHVWGWAIYPSTYPGKTNNTWFVWDSFVHGHNPIYLDDGMSRNHPPEQSVRNAMGYARTLANRIDLNHMVPGGAITSTGRALVKANAEYVVYQPSTSSFTVRLPAGSFDYEWINLVNGSITHKGIVKAIAGNNTFTPPSGYNSNYGAILHLVLHVKGPTPVGGGSL